jgi:hypothetical protein
VVVGLAPTAVAANALGPGGGAPPPKKGRLTGKPTEPEPNEKNPDNLRAIERENESARLLADNGYDVEQNPLPKINGKKPDYKINGEYYDCLAPSTPNARNIASRIQDEKVDGGQVDKIILNLEDSSVTIEAMKTQLLDWPIPGLKEVIAIKDGKLILLYP